LDLEETKLMPVEGRK